MNGRASTAPLLSSVDVYPRTEEFRYRVYENGPGGLRCLAAAPASGLGLALVTLDADACEAGGRLDGAGTVGVLDAVERRWIVTPFRRSEAALGRGEPSGRGGASRAPAVAPSVGGASPRSSAEPR